MFKKRFTQWFLFLVVGLVVSAVFSIALAHRENVYYVDARNGSDSIGNGTIARPWKTIQKASDAMNSGDRCIIRAGTYRETVTAGDGETFEAYRGEYVLVTGLDVVTGWELKAGSNNIYKAIANQEVKEVFVGGVRMNLARFPNEDGNMFNWDDWLSSTANNTSTNGTGTADVTFSSLNKGLNYWKGGYYIGLHGRNFYETNMGKISSSDGNRIAITDLTGQIKNNNPEFEGAGRGFIINHLNALDTAKEWYWGDRTLYLWTPNNEDPNKARVEAQVRIWGFDLSNKKNITIKGINFKAASVLMEGTINSIIDGCTFRYHSPAGFHYNGAGHYGGTEDGTSGIFVSGSHNTIKNSYIGHAWGQGITVIGSNSVVENNLLEDMTWMIGGAPVVVSNTDNLIKNNTIRTCAGMGLAAVQSSPQRLVKRPKIVNNDISDVGKMLLDSGQAAMYIGNTAAPTADRTLEGGVIAYNKIGKVNIFQNNGKGMGIYLDDGTDGAVIHHNVINAGGGIKWAIFLHYNGHIDENILVYHNTIFGYTDRAVWFAGNWDGRGGGCSNCVVRNNIAERRGFNGDVVSHNRENVPVSDFVNAGSGDFHLQAHSTSINAGVAVSGINDTVADGKPDLGAYEYGDTRGDWSAGSTVKLPRFPD